MLTLTGLALLFIAIWILVPAPFVWLLPLGVLAPEISPILLALAAILALLALRRVATRKLALVIALVVAAVSAVPLSKLSKAVREFDREMAKLVPNASRVPAPANGRPAPFVVRDMFLGIRTGEVRVERALNFSEPDGRKLVLDVYRPPGAGPHPMLVQLYGGAWQWGNRTDNETFARYFASRGYVVFAIEYRHAPNAPWPAALVDTRAAVAWAAGNGKSYDADPSRLAIVGRSSGAQLALMAAYSGQSRIAAVVSYYGFSDLAAEWRQPPDPDPVGVRSTFETFLGGTPDTVPAKYHAASPIAFVSGGAPPTLLIHGARDHVVPPAFARALQARLKSVGARSALLELPWAEHTFDLLPSGLSGQVALYYTERFLAAELRR